MDTISFLNDIWHNAIVRVLVTIIVLALVNLVSHRLIQTIIRHAVRPSRHHVTRDDEVKRENTLIHIFRTAITVIIAIVGVVIILGEIGINVAALATGAGLVGVLVGFGAQNAIRDYLAGIFIIIENQYRVGDIVAVSGGTIGAGKSGVVEDVTIRITKLRDLDGVLHIIRNGEPSIISNLSINFANVNVDLSVAYNADVDAAATIINRVGIEQAGDEAWRHDIIEPIHFLRIDQFVDSAMVLKSLGKVQPARQWDIAGDFRHRIKVAFEAEGVAMALPQVVVHSADHHPVKPLKHAKPAAAKKRD